MSTCIQQTPVLTVQVDVDTLRHLCVFYGLTPPAEGEDDPVYRLALPRFADLFETLGLRATFFVVGEDLHHKPNGEVVRQLHAAGHEIANHTQTHAYHFIRLNRQQKHDEIERAGQAVARLTGSMPVGFRAPGYDVDQDVLAILADLGYSYDSSVMPSMLNLPFKLVQVLLRKNRQVSGYGHPALCLAPNRPYHPHTRAIWRSAATAPLWEIPVSCVPYVRLPFYANFNLLTGHTLFRLAAALGKRRHCNYVFHAVEMLDGSEIDPRLHRHPNARLPLKQKLSHCRRFLQRLKERRQVLLSKDFAAELRNAATVGTHVRSIPFEHS
jgi:peptidoglycan/xylan/chitin deacetylase (PgdA/CDA1 family)